MDPENPNRGPLSRTGVAANSVVPRAPDSISLWRLRAQSGIMSGVTRAAHSTTLKMSCKSLMEPTNDHCLPHTATHT